MINVGKYSSPVEHLGMLNPVNSEKQAGKVPLLQR